MAHRIPEGRGRLARQGAPGCVGDRAGNHQGQRLPMRLHRLDAGKDRGLGVQRVEDRLDQQDVGAAFDQAPCLLQIGCAQIVKGDGAVSGVVHIRADGRGAVRRPDGARDETRPPVLRGGAIQRPAHDACALDVQVENVPASSGSATARRRFFLESLISTSISYLTSGGKLSKSFESISTLGLTSGSW